MPRFFFIRNSSSALGSIDSRDYLPLAVITSLLSHVILLFFLTSGFVLPTQSPQVMYIDVLPFLEEALERAAEESTPAEEHRQDERRQIVSRPEIESSRTPAQTRYLSDVDSRAEQEMIRRGDDPDAGAAQSEAQAERDAATLEEATPQPQQPAAPAEEPSTTPRQPERSSAPPPAAPREAPTLTTRLSGGDLLANVFGSRHGGGGADDSARELADLGTAGSPPRGGVTSSEPYRAFTRSPGEGARFFGSRGQSDFLPDLPDGDITLLNTKANQYATFVRRVALEVFRSLRASGLQSLGGGEIASVKGFVTIHAVMSPTGELIDLKIQEKSGSERFDRIVEASARRGTRDPNPPLSAALEDGNIHFIFKSRVWSRVVQDPRMGPREQRWVLLSTGLM